MCHLVVVVPLEIAVGKLARSQVAGRPFGLRNIWGEIPEEPWSSHLALFKYLPFGPFQIHKHIRCTALEWCWILLIGSCFSALLC